MSLHDHSRKSCKYANSKYREHIQISVTYFVYSKTHTNHDHVRGHLRSRGKGNQSGEIQPWSGVRSTNFAAWEWIWTVRGVKFFGILETVRNVLEQTCTWKFKYLRYLRIWQRFQVGGMPHTLAKLILEYE